MKTIVQIRIDDARRLIDEGKFDGLVASSVDVRGLLDDLEALQRGVKDLAISHGVRGASGPRQPTIEETAEHIAKVMCDWMARANAFDAAVNSARTYCERVIAEAVREEDRCGKAGSWEERVKGDTCKQILEHLNGAPQSWVSTG